MNPDAGGQSPSMDDLPQPAGYLAGILERLKNCGPAPVRSRAGTDCADEADSGQA
jgi:hypothetical protein